MGYPRKRSFMIFSDENAPTEVKELDPQKVAEIEATHQEEKKRRVDEQILTYLTPQRNKGDRGPRIGFDPAAQEKGRETAKVHAAGSEGERLRRIVARVQDAAGDEEAFKEFVRTDREVSEQGNESLRKFAWSVFEIETSKAELPDTRYRPRRSSETTVRFKDGGRLGIREVAPTARWDESKGEHVLLTEGERWHGQGTTLWVRVADGAWSKDGDWGGYLQVTCATEKGKWLDSKNGWLTPIASKAEPVTFYDMGNYYEIWQKDRETGRPLMLWDDGLRFHKDAQPGKFNLADSAWD
ncbi:hypothetical protein ACFUJY_00620 [Streptomyces sp. NPDC057249]|uniref:hypothetical protein n=1 Tax=Streptomyces sp. NPDC057249 TaxID=3346067 RepID=UPI003637C174